VLRYSKLAYIAQSQHLYGIYSMLPDRHLWRYDNYESIPVPAEDDPGGLHAYGLELYEACLRDLTAAVLGLAWKARECTAVSVQALNQRRLSASAAAARAAFEAATAAIDHVVRLQKTRRQYRMSKDFGALIQRLDESSTRGLWGRKGVTEGDIKANHFLKHQESVLKFAGPAHEEIQEWHPVVYDMLCNMTHPSADGHQQFWHLPKGPPPVSGAPVWIEMSSEPDLRPAYLQRQLKCVLWALGWSCAHSVRAYDLCVEEQRDFDAMPTNSENPAALTPVANLRYDAQDRQTSCSTCLGQRGAPAT
jgi:hypothetical protein